MLNVKSTPGIC